MDFFELLLESINTLKVNKMRTGLAVLGIVIGVGSVIALMSLGEGSQQSVQQQIQSLGSNLLTVSPGSPSAGGIRGAAGGVTTLTYDDAKAIITSSEITDVKNVSPEYSSRAQVIAGRNNENTQVVGVTPAYMEVHKINIDSGSFITQRDVDAYAKVAVMGPTAATNLFGDPSAAIGQTIRIKGNAVKVVGITVAKGGSGFQNQDDMVFMPLFVVQKQLFGSEHLTSIAIEAKSQEVMTEAQNQIGYLLLTRHKLSTPQDADFTILSQNDILGAATQITGTITALLSGIAAISLLVGGIGIMNIMLVTVTERTREIGLRKALGAKRKVVITQFLIESIVLTFTGGLVGLGFGIIASYIVSVIFKFPFVISLQSVLLAVGVSGAIGILFGWYPAQKASNLQPIEALRYE